MILSGKAIRKRLVKGEVFRASTWDKKCLKEASYALRVAPDGLMFEDERYPPGQCIKDDYIEIKPGKIAILSTVERLNMPADLVGKIGIRLRFALQGITGLMGIQVDPLYGHDKKDERLYIRVANLGNEPVKIRRCDDVFTFELHKVKGGVRHTHKEDMWNYINRQLEDQRNLSWTYASRVESELNSKIAAAIERNRDYLQPVVMFGIFLIAVTILGVSLSTILNVEELPEINFRQGSLITSIIEVMLLVLLGVAIVVTLGLGVTAIWKFCKRN